MLCDISTWNGYWSGGTGSVGFSRANDFSGNLATGNHSVAFTHIATNNLRGAGGNGIFVTDTAVSYLTDPSRDEITLGWNRRQGVNERPAVGEFTYFAAFNRALSDAELISVATNPWQLFKPLRIYIPTAAAAATAPTITALSAINITATSAQPQITYA